ncbi:hypothetical protein F66182_7326 [Fusarium sp. NRRL 66182]|nr:hypothetical protein F66182_7326 [Fusarium sp. NRRL 66182]
MAASPDVTSITPQGLGLVLLVVTLFLVPPTSAVVVLRCWIRLKHRVFGTDDALMLAGWVSVIRRVMASAAYSLIITAQILFLPVVGLVSVGTYHGIGARDERLNGYLVVKSNMLVWIFRNLYCFSLVLVKASICTTLLRIAVVRSHRIIAWITLATSCISTIVVIIGLFAICRPIRANWDPSAGTCSSPVVIVSLSYLVSAAAVATDFVCSILPGFMLYKAQMKLATKVSISVILGMGILASIATIVRLPYIKFYADPIDFQYHVGHITLWSIFESGIGIIAGSLPSLRRLVKSWVNFDSSHGRSSSNVTPFTGAAKSTVTSKVGVSSSARRHKSIMANVKSDRDWEPLDDASSSRKIYVTVDMEMQSLERPPTSARSRESFSDV